MTQKQIADAIVKRFFELRATTGYKLSYEWIKNHLKRRIKPGEAALVGLALDELISRDIITIDNNEETLLVLTKNGFDSLYKVEPLKAIKRLSKEIMSRFKTQHSQPNHVLILTWLEQNLSNDFNPKEMELLQDSITSLAEEGYVQKETKNNFCIILTQAGFDSINYAVNLKEAS